MLLICFDMAKKTHIITLVVSLLLLLVLALPTVAMNYFGVQPIGGILLAVLLGVVAIIVISIAKLMKQK